LRQKKIEAADRVKQIPPYLFAKIDEMKAEARAGGADLIDFGIGDPDLPTPPHVIEALREAAGRTEHHRYPPYAGTARCREALARFYADRFGVALDPGSEVLALIGSKDGISHLPLAIVNPGDLALVPDPAYPVYATTTRFVGGDVFRFRLDPARQFQPDLEAIPADLAEKAKLIYINYPNNPTGGVASVDDLQRILSFAEEHDLLVVSDLAYSEIYLEEPRPPSFLELARAKERCLEFYSLSKTYNMTGWRIGFAVGNPDLVAALGKIKTNMDSGVFGAVQEAAIAAMSGDQACVKQMCDVYRERRDLLVASLRELGLTVAPQRATFYLFIPVPAGTTSIDFAARLLKEAGLVVTPGNGFGEHGEGFVRFSLSVDSARIEEAVERIKKLRL
jgi:LL-diaminopimelate aminotransferase